MPLLLTNTLPFLAHDHAAAAAFLTCRRHNYHGSIIPEFLSDEERVKSFCEARQQKNLVADEEKQYKNLFYLFAQTPLMQFSPSLVLLQKDGSASILKPLLQTKYFTRTLQRCSVINVDASAIHRRLRFLFSNVQAPTELQRSLTTDLLQGLSNVRSCTEFDLGMTAVENQQLEIIVNSFTNLKTLTIENAKYLDSRTAVTISSPPPRATQTLSNLTLNYVDASWAAQFVPHFINLKELMLFGRAREADELDLLPLTSSLPRLTALELEHFSLKNSKSLENLVDLSSLRFDECRTPDSLNFLSPGSLPRLTTLSLVFCRGLSTSSFKSLTHAFNLHSLSVICSHADEFNNDCLQYLEDMVHLRKLNLNDSNIVGDGRSLKTLMQNLLQLEELNLEGCRNIGNQGAIAGALYSIHSRLRVLRFGRCDLVEDDLKGIRALKSTLEELELTANQGLTSEALVHCTELVKLKKLTLQFCHSIDDLAPLKDCSNLEELNVSLCIELTDNSFKVFSEEPNSFPNLSVLELAGCKRLTEDVFEHLSKNKHLVYRLKELDVRGKFDILASSETARKSLCQLKGLRQLHFGADSDESKDLKLELLRELKNLEGF